MDYDTLADTANICDEATYCPSAKMVDPWCNLDWSAFALYPLDIGHT